MILMTEKEWWNELEPIEYIKEYTEEQEECLTKDLKRLYEEIEKRILADPESVTEIKRVANKFNEKEEIVLIHMILKYFVKMGIISQQDIKDIIGGG